MMEANIGQAAAERAAGIADVAVCDDRQHGIRMIIRGYCHCGETE